MSLYERRTGVAEAGESVHDTTACRRQPLVIAEPRPVVCCSFPPARTL
jgi:hypothetical protein